VWGSLVAQANRRDDDLILLGQLSAQIFDYIIVKEDDDKRGRAEGEVANLIIKGITQENPENIMK
jgi:cyanophycin synthetase